MNLFSNPIEHLFDAKHFIHFRQKYFVIFTKVITTNLEQIYFLGNIINVVSIYLSIDINFRLVIDSGYGEIYGPHYGFLFNLYSMIKLEIHFFHFHFFYIQSFLIDHYLLK